MYPFGATSAAGRVSYCSTVQPRSYRLAHPVACDDPFPLAPPIGLSADGFIIQVAWANRARILQGRARNSQEVLMEQEAIYVGIDVAKAQVDVAVRPTDDRWEVPHD